MSAELAELADTSARLAAREVACADDRAALAGLCTRLAETEAKRVAANWRHELEVQNLETGGRGGSSDSCRPRWTF